VNINRVIQTRSNPSWTGFALIALLALLPGSGVSSAWASDCQVTLSRPVVDYGKWVPGEENGPNRGNIYPLSENNVMVNAFCSEPQKMALFFSGTPRDGGFLFGDKGVLAIEAYQSTVDGKHVRLGKSAGMGGVSVEGGAEEKVIVRNNDGLMPVNDQQVVVGQQFQVLLKLKPVLNASGLKPADQTLIKSALNIRVEVE